MSYSQGSSWSGPSYTLKNDAENLCIQSRMSWSERLRLQLLASAV
jgi:hypothetical protein